MAGAPAVVTPRDEVVATPEGTALGVVATGPFALMVPVPVQVLWLVAALAASVLAVRRPSSADRPDPPAV